MLWIFAAAIFAFIMADVAYNMVKTKSRLVSPTQAKRETERLVKMGTEVAALEAEIDRKLEEIRGHPSAQVAVPPRPAAMAPAILEAPGTPRDSSTDTRCLQAVKEKVEEVKRLAKER